MSRSQPVKPGRPRTFDTDQAVDAALELFWRHGFVATSSRDLEHAMKLRASSIYNAFGDKTRLLEICVERYRDRLTEAVIEPLRASTDGLASIDRFIQRMQAWLTANDRQGCLIGRLMSEGPPSNPSIHAHLQAHRKVLRESVRSALKRAVDAREIVDESVPNRTEIVLASLLALNSAVVAGDSDGRIRAIGQAARAQVREWNQLEIATAGQ